MHGYARLSWHKTTVSLWTTFWIAFQGSFSIMIILVQMSPNFAYNVPIGTNAARIGLVQQAPTITRKSMMTQSTDEYISQRSCDVIITS